MDLQMQEADISGYIPNGEWDLIGEPRGGGGRPAAQKRAALFLGLLSSLGFPTLRFGVFTAPCGTRHDSPRATGLDANAMRRFGASQGDCGNNHLNEPVPGWASVHPANLLFLPSRWTTADCIYTGVKFTVCYLLSWRLSPFWVAHKQQTFISRSSGAWTSKIKVLADLVSGEGSFPIHGQLPSHCVSMTEGQGALRSLRYKGTNPPRRAAPF